MNVYITHWLPKMPVTTERTGQNLEAVQSSGVLLIAAVHSPCAGRSGLILIHLTSHITGHTYDCRQRAVSSQPVLGSSRCLSCCARCADFKHRQQPL